MTSTTNLAAPHWTASQNQPDVTHNSALDVFDSCIAGINVIDFSVDADYTLGIGGAYPREYQYMAFEMTDTGVVLTGPVNVIVPTVQKLYFFLNSTAQTLTVKTGGTGIAVTTALPRAILFCDGTNVVQWTTPITP